MGIFIRKMRMPTGNDELRLIIHSNGQVIISHKTHYEEAEAISVSPHGPLIDSNRLIDIGLHLAHTAKNDDIANGVKWLWQYIIEEPVIIEADTAEEGE